MKGISVAASQRSLEKWERPDSSIFYIVFSWLNIRASDTFSGSHVAFYLRVAFIHV